MFIEIVQVEMVQRVDIAGNVSVVSRKSVEEGRVRFTFPELVSEEFTEARVALHGDGGQLEGVTVVGPVEPDLERQWGRFGVRAGWVRACG